MNRRPPPRIPQSGRPRNHWPRHHWYPYHNWYWYDYDYDWGYDDMDLYDYYYHFDRYDTSRDAYDQGFKAGLKQARKEISTSEDTNLETRSAGYCGSTGA